MRNSMQRSITAYRVPCLIILGVWLASVLAVFSIYLPMAAQNSNFHVIQSDSQFQQQLIAAGDRLVVVDFFAEWLVRIIWKLCG